jgi:hypothetical protein
MGGVEVMATLRMTSAGSLLSRHARDGITGQVTFVFYKNGCYYGYFPIWPDKAGSLREGDLIEPFPSLGDALYDVFDNEVDDDGAYL